jgi:anti-anti-sigma regulatory factor/anti-sigma regulatory factor (Ser/Thr protein kinase)
MDERRTAALTCTIENDFPVLVVRASGRMTFASVSVLRRVVRKGLTDHPALLLIDLSAVEVIDDVTVTVFAWLARRGAENDVPVMLVAPPPPLAGHLDALGVGRSVPTYATEELARSAHAGRAGSWRRQVDLDPVPSATAVARDLVDQACVGWRLREVADVAALVATELVANAVQHARTPMIFAVTRRPTYLHLACRDSSHVLPRRDAGEGDDTPAGRGLLIIEAMAMGWGFSPTADGKVVWATVRSRR